MPQGGRPTFKKAPARASGTASAAAAASTEKDWQRSSGAFSGAAKKEYLKWKRHQKAACVDSSSDDEGHQRGSGNQPAAQHAANARQQSQQPPQQQRRRNTPASAPGAEATLPLQYRPLAAISAASFCMTAARATASTAPCAAHTPSGAATDTAGTYSSEGHDSAAAADPGASQVTFMPRLDPAKVGYTPEGWSLGMPTRPKWQVRPGSESHCYSSPKPHEHALSVHTAYNTLLALAHGRRVFALW
jgi:hypothetical protein